MSDYTYIDTTSNFVKDEIFSSPKEVFDFIESKSVSPLFNARVGLNVKSEEGKKILRIDENSLIKRIDGENFYFASKPSIKEEICERLFESNNISLKRICFAEWWENNQTHNSFVYYHENISIRYSEDLGWLDFVDNNENKQFYFSNFDQISIMDNFDNFLYVIDFARLMQKKSSLPNNLVIIRDTSVTNEYFDQIKDKIGFVVNKISEIGGYRCYFCEK